MFLEWENNSGKLQIISGKFQNSWKFQNNAINDVKQIYWSMWLAEVILSWTSKGVSEPCQKSNVKRFANAIKDWILLISFDKDLILDVWQDLNMSLAPIILWKMWLILLSNSLTGSFIWIFMHWWGIIIYITSIRWLGRSYLL